MSEYDITQAFKRIEDELIGSMIRNLDRHKDEEVSYDMNWSMWQVEQLKGLEQYKANNRKKYGKEFEVQNKKIKDLIRMSKSAGGLEQETKILEAIQKGFTGRRQPLSGNFFRLNERKLEALINATVSDMKKAETAILRMSNDKYRQVIFNAQMYANSGAGTYQTAVDMATKDMLAAGLNCVEYKNGARHTLPNYTNMAIRTANKRAYLQGEGEKRQEWGISTVIMNKRGNPCPRCLPFCGKVLIDDVWSGGKNSDGDYPLMSAAITKGLYHPSCKDSHSTFFHGISTPPDDKWTKAELRNIEVENIKEEKRGYAKRQEDKFKRLAKYSLDDENKNNYGKKAAGWNNIVESIEKSGYDSSIKEYRVTRFDKKSIPFKQVAQLYKVVNDLPATVKNALKGIEFKLGSKIGSGYKPFEKTVYLADNISRKEILHEIGHVIEDKLLDKNAVDALKRKYIEGLTTKDIITRKATDSSGNEQHVYLLENDKFIRDYQGRLYIENLEQAVNTEGELEIDNIGEFISVAFEYYNYFPKLMKKNHSELYKLINGGIKNEK